MALTENALPPAEAAIGHAWFQIRFSSLRELLPGICQIASSLATGSSTAVSPKLALVLRELLINAIEHGNQDESGRVVDFRMDRLGAGSVAIAIADEGAGFEMDPVDLCPQEVPADSTGSGLRLVNALCDSLVFENGGRRVICKLTWDNEFGSAAFAGNPHNHNDGKE